MHMEIERKFKISDDWTVPRDVARQRVRQAYLTSPGSDSEIRVREKGEVRVLTVKSPVADAGSLVRKEVEFEIDDEIFEQLWEMARGHSLSKIRSIVPVGDRVAAVDVYEGPLAGLRVVEVEFDSVDTAKAFIPPSWFGEEVTDDPAWSNRELAAIYA